ncbi:hypothetical protein [Halocella sp. SP3-1]|uniref:hypothetical protein n=1 Tax=Halocella sp. SP3-1 TaxID=2382161 RepID=UPI000F7F2B61|nr:hypothetical protein [Halocella sp. SP3-1]
MKWAVSLGIGTLILEIFIVVGQKFWKKINAKIEESPTKWDDYARDTVIDALVNAGDYLPEGNAKELLEKFISEVINNDRITDTALIEKAQQKIDELEKK